MPEPQAPRLGLDMGVAPPGTLMALVQEVARRVDVVDLGDVGRADAALVRILWGRAPDGAPRRREAWWVDSADGALEAPPSRRPDLVLSPHGDVVAAARARGFRARIVPDVDVEPESCPVPPFVRERLRRARVLGDGLLVEDASGRCAWDGALSFRRLPERPGDRRRRTRPVGPDEPVEPPALRPEEWPADDLLQDLMPTALATAAAAYLVSPESVVRAMAWGCPVVAPASTLETIGATPGRDSIADDGSEPVLQLRRLSGDPLLSARVSREGRLRYEAAHSLSSCADELLRVLGLATRWRPSSMALRLDELDSRRGEPQRRRVGEMVSPIVTS